MPQLEITPWRYRSQLLTVRHQFYPSNPSDLSELDKRRRAVNQVVAWKFRGNLPHAVEATALLTDAILNDDSATVSAQAIVAAYATAFSRFVTGLTDTEQTKKYKQSMYAIAKDIDLPAAWVELRHRIIHEEMPPLVVLRREVPKALGWLWKHYWAALENGDHQQTEQEQDEMDEDSPPATSVEVEEVEAGNSVPRRNIWVPTPIGEVWRGKQWIDL